VCDIGSIQTGAVLPPTVPSLIGGIEVVRGALPNRGNEYPGSCFYHYEQLNSYFGPGELLALLAKTLGNIHCVRILFEDRVRTPLSCLFSTCSFILLIVL
jgi:hypothetical protein